MPKMSGLEVQEKLNERNNKIPIIFMTGNGDIPMKVRAMKDGACVGLAFCKVVIELLKVS